VERSIKAGGSNLGMYFCTTCTHPNTRPRIEFDENGRCNGCVRADEKQAIDWSRKEEEFRAVAHEIVSRSPDREYDCVIPVSGGKDSTFQTWYAIEKLGLNPLCVNISPYLPTPIAQHNLRNIAENLDADVLSWIPNQTVFSQLTRICFEKYGDPYVPFLYLLFANITKIALEKKIPLILYGENGEKEYAGSSKKEFTELDNDGVEARIKSDKRDFLPPERWTEWGFSEAQIRPYVDPDDTKMADIGLQRLFFSDFTAWTNNFHLHVALNVVGGFEMTETRGAGTFTFGYATDDDLYDIYIWLLWPKFGFGRATKYTSKDIQEGKITRENALQLVRDYDGEFPWGALDRFLEKTGLSETKFWEVVGHQIGDEKNLRREAEKFDTDMKIPAWEKIDDRHWRLRNSLHGVERILELPLKRPSGNVDPLAAGNRPN